MEFSYEVWDPPGIATHVKKIDALRPLSASGTMYRRQSGRGAFLLPSDFARLAEVIEVDPANHANDVASTIKVFRDSTLIQELLVNASPNIVTGQDASLACDGIEAVMDWAVTEAWDWDGTADFSSTVPDWIYGGRNLLPPLALGDLGSIREEWTLYLSGEAYELDPSLATSGDYTLTVGGNTTAPINWDATHTQIKAALEALAGVTTVSVLQADPDRREFVVVFENPKDLGADMTADFTGTGGLGTLTKLNDGFNTGANPTFTITVDGQTTNALAWNASAKTVQGSPLSGNGLEGLSNVNDVEVSGTGISSDPWTIAFYDPPDPTTVTVTFAAGTAVFTKTQEGDPDPSPVTLSQAIDASRDVSQHGTYDLPPIQVVTTPLDAGASWSLLVNATGQFAGSQIVINNVQPGQLYQASIRVRPTVDGEYVLVIRDEFENFIAQSEPRHTLLTAGTFQELNVVDIQIPEGVTRVIMRVAVVDFNSNAWADFYVNWEGAEFLEGQAATTLGTIMGHLLDDAQTDHAASPFARSTIGFVNKSFDDALDTAGNVWADPELSVNIPRGMTYRKVLDRIFGQLGYEWNLTPTVGTPGDWDLNVWNPGARGTDHSAAATPSILLGQGTLSGSATKSLPSGNIVISEGAQQYSSRAANSASYGTIGRREWYQADISFQTTQVESWTDTTLAKFLDVSLKPRFEIADPPSDEWPVPIVNYDLADTLNVDLADGSGKITREIEAISWRTEADGIIWGVHTGEAQFDAVNAPGGGGGSSSVGAANQGDPNVGGAAAVAPQRGIVAVSGPVNEGVRRLIDQFDRLVRPEVPSAFVPGGGKGAPTVVVAPANSSDISKSKADFIAAGADDQVTLNQALAIIAATFPFPGRLLLTEGRFDCTGPLTVTGAEIQGLGNHQTLINFTGVSAGTPAVDMGGTGPIMRDLRIQSSGDGVEMSGQYGRLYNSYVAVSTGGTVVTVSDSDVIVSDCLLAGDPASLALFGIFGGDHRLTSRNNDFIDCTRAIDLQGAGNHITGCTTSNCTWFVDMSAFGSDTHVVNNGNIGGGVAKIMLGASADNLVITGNIMAGGIEDSASVCQNVIITHNTFETPTVTASHAIIDLASSYSNLVVAQNVMQGASGLVGIRLTGQSQAQLLGNTVWAALIGIELDGGDNNVVQANFVRNSEQHSVRLHNGANDNLVSGNYVYRPGTSASNTYDAFIVEGSDRNMISDNYVFRGALTPRYGINIADLSCDCNIAVGNRLGTGYGTDAINDAGIDTSWRYPDDPVYGDNFTDCAPTPS